MPSPPSTRAVETARLRLAPLTEADAAALQAITDDPKITGAIDFLPSPFTVEDARAFIRGEPGDVIFGLWRKDTDALAGIVGTHPRGADEIEIGYWIAAACHGQGYASEGARVVIGFLSTMSPARRIIAECRPENTASWRVLEKLGFRPTGADGSRAGRKMLVLG